MYMYRWNWKHQINLPVFFPPAERHAEKQAAKAKVGTPNGSLMMNDNNNKPEPTWIHEIFQGTLTNETRCLCCEGVSYAWNTLMHINQWDEMFVLWGGRYAWNIPRQIHQWDLMFVLGSGVSYTWNIPSQIDQWDLMFVLWGGWDTLEIFQDKLTNETWYLCCEG